MQSNAAGLYKGWGNQSADGWVTAAKQNTNGGLYRTDNTGNDEYHNNVAPCISAYVWERTA